MIDIIVLILSLTLLHLHIYFGGMISLGILKVIFSIPLWIIIIRYFSIKRILSFFSINKLLFLFFLMIAIANLRSFILGVATINELFFNVFTTITVLLFAISLFQSNNIDQRKLIFGIFGSIGFYNLLNIVMYLLGYRSDAKRLFEMYTLALDKAVMLESLGVDIDRTLFPLTNGLNNFGVVCGIAVVFWGVILLRKDNNSKIIILSFTFIVSSLMGLLMTDSRGPLLFSIVCILIIMLIPDNKKYFIPKVIYILPIIIPILFYSIDYITDFLNNYNINILDDLSRGPSSDVQQFAGRAIVWQSAFDKLSSFSFSHIFGYGWYGQTISGTINDYYNLALMFSNPERITLHNSYLQYIFNIGYIGLLIFIILYIKMFHKLLSDKYKSQTTLSSAFVAVLLFMALAALFEVNLAMIGDESIFIVVFIFVILSKSDKGYI